jgi:hypothetical protein
MFRQESSKEHHKILNFTHSCERVRSLYYKNTDHQQMHKESFIINCNTLLHVSTLLDHLQGELFCYPYAKGQLYS